MGEFMMVVLVISAVGVSVLHNRREAARTAERLARVSTSWTTVVSDGLVLPAPHSNGGVDSVGGDMAVHAEVRRLLGGGGAMHGPAEVDSSPARRSDEAEGFPIRRPADLPTFAEVGGMEELKQEVRDTVGLVLRNQMKAARYGISWNGLLLHGPPGVGKTFMARAIAGEHGMSLLHVSTGDLVEGVVGASARNVQKVFAAAVENRPCLLLFDEFDSIAERRDESGHAEERRTVNQLLTCLEEIREHPNVVVVATTNSLDSLDPAVVRPGRFDRHVRIDLPDAAARMAIFTEQLEHRPSHDTIDLDELSRRTEGLTPAAIVQTVDAAAFAAFKEAAEAGAVVRITMEHLLGALAERGGRDRPTVEEWDWDDLVLPADVKAELQQLQALVEDPDLAESFGVAPPSGVLLAGPPGTGKTTVARVLAAQASCSFYAVSAADVTSKWVGESERNIKRLFERARENRPSIVFIDEIDAIGSRRDAGDNDSTARLLNQLLVEIDGMSGRRGILVIAATNRPELLDPALVRGGRLSRTVTLPLPDEIGRRAILRLATARMPTVGVDLHTLARATHGCSGADLKAICQQAALHALVRARGESNPAVTPARVVTHDDFIRALADRRASIAAHAN